MLTDGVGFARHAFQDDVHCGDDGASWRDGESTVLCLIDGLGHGPHAEDAAQAALDYVSAHHSETLHQIFEGCDRAIRGTRGVSMNIAVVDASARRVTYAGIGANRFAVVSRREAKRLMSSRGAIGRGYGSLHLEELPVDGGDCIVLFSDGVSEMAELSRYGADAGADVQGLAEHILQDWSLGTDDAAVMVYRVDAT